MERGNVGGGKTVEEEESKVTRRESENEHENRSSGLEFL